MAGDQPPSQGSSLLSRISPGPNSKGKSLGTRLVDDGYVGNCNEDFHGDVAFEAFLPGPTLPWDICNFLKTK